MIGIQADGCFFEDVQLVLKYLTEWLFHTSAKESIIQITPSNFALSSLNIHYLILMVRGYSLNTLQLSSPLFGNHKFMSLFCEALKYSKVLNLQLNDSSIGDSSLLLLASTICDTRTELTMLHIFNNPYTKHGLTGFFKCLLEDSTTVDLVQIILDGQNLTEDHWKNIHFFYYLRSCFRRDYPPLIVKAHKGWLVEPRARKELLSYHRLITQPHLSSRTPHHF